MSTVQLLGPNKKAEVVYEHLNLLVFVIIELLSKISGNRDCERKLVNRQNCCIWLHRSDIISFYAQNAWTRNIADAVFTDPPVSHCVTQ